MCDNTPDSVRQSALVVLGEFPPFDLGVEVFPELTDSTQCLQSSHLLSTRFYDTDLRVALDASDFRTSAGAIPNDNYVQSLAVRWSTSGTGQYPLPELLASKELTFSPRFEGYEDNDIMEYPSAFTTPTVPQLTLLGTETFRDTPVISPFPGTVTQGGCDEIILKSLSQAGCVNPSQECYTRWMKVPVDAIVVTGSNIFVPQTLYRPFTETDKQRYLEQISLSEPIIFVKTKPFEWGISLGDVHKGNMQYLEDRDAPVLQDCGPSISIRINWPGYPPFKHQISSRNWRKTKGPITKGKLAQTLATTTGRFIEKMSNKTLEAGADRKWKLGPQHISADDLILVSLHQVSKGSWQPQFRLQYDMI